MWTPQSWVAFPANMPIRFPLQPPDSARVFQVTQDPDGQLQGPRSPGELLLDRRAVVVSEVPTEVFSPKGEKEPTES